MKKSLIKISLAALACLFANEAQAQFTLDGQLVQRGEYRHGFGTPIAKNADAAVFIGQRARLSAQYKVDRFTFYTSIQDVRIWGSAPQIKSNDPYLSVHEAWAETKFGENFSLKLGRQELNYDNARFLGNLDWALQGRAHDFALAKWETGTLKLHAGAGYNQDNEKLSGNLFTVAPQYKAAQFLRFENTLGNLSYSLLFWNNGRQYVVNNPLDPTKIEKQGIRYMQTLGIPTLKYQLGNTTLSGFYYYQLGKDEANKKVNAYNANAQISQLLALNEEEGSKLRLTAGVEFLSGTDANATDNKNRSFAPLYGTNHAHNGYMDLFFVGGRQEKSVGLQDYYLRTRYDVNPKLFVSGNLHSFRSHGNIPQESSEASRNLGTESLGYEVDLTGGYLISDAVSLQAGYSQLFGSGNLEKIRGIAHASGTQNWGYVMMIYRPNMKNKFIGLQF